MTTDFDVFDKFFGRNPNSAMLCTRSLDDGSYRRLHSQYVAEISGKWGLGSIPTEKGFERWLQEQVRSKDNGK